MTYAEKLKDPRWQKKRLEILKRDGFRCRSCDNGERTLHVHHLNEDYSIPPWKHKDEDMITLCELCHSYIHDIYKKGIYPEFVSLVVDLYDRWSTNNLNPPHETKISDWWSDLGNKSSSEGEVING